LFWNQPLHFAAVLSCGKNFCNLSGIWPLLLSRAQENMTRVKLVFLCSALLMQRFLLLNTDIYLVGF